MSLAEEVRDLDQLAAPDGAPPMASGRPDSRLQRLNDALNTPGCRRVAGPLINPGRDRVGPDSVPGSDVPNTDKEPETDEEPEAGELESEEPEAEKPEPGLLAKELVEGVKSTALAWGRFLLAGVAYTHGFGWAVRTVEVVLGVGKWVLTDKDGGGVDLATSLPLGPGVALSVSFHAAGDPEVPSLTFGVTPAGESGIGALVMGDLELDPAPHDARKDEAESGESEAEPGESGATSDRGSRGSGADDAPRVFGVQRHGHVLMISGWLPGEMPAGSDPADVVASVCAAAEQEWLPRLLDMQPLFHKAGVTVVFVCDYEKKVAFWADLRGVNQPEIEPRSVEEGWLGITVVPGAVNLAMRSKPGTGLVVTLRPSRSGATAGPVAPSAASRPPVTAASPGPVPLSSGWSGGVQGFTSWLVANTPLLTEAVGGQVTFQGPAEEADGLPSSVASLRTRTGERVIVSGQLEPADDAQLGALLTLVAAIRPRYVIWVAADFSSQHRTALGWFNELADGAVQFFAVQLTVVTLDESPVRQAAPRFELVVSPRD